MLASGAGALLFGTVLGLSTVGGLRDRPQPAGPIYPRASPPSDPIYTADAPDCDGCTNYDAGYRWASARGIATVDDCFGEDWARQRGCLAFVQGGRID
ncbi:hypothetical protein [Sphingomonas montana]|uniref:hypothetical protein n=1 Tax=Sphingomonas montana TaxID=1843236 RepID=UPI00096D401B|nr:hypothetical protein [Sphingomonas montana]